MAVDHTPLASVGLRDQLDEALHDVQMLGYENGTLRYDADQLADQIAAAWKAMPAGVREAAEHDGASLAAAVQAMSLALHNLAPGWPGLRTSEANQ